MVLLPLSEAGQQFALLAVLQDARRSAAPQLTMRWLIIYAKAVCAAL